MTEHIPYYLAFAAGLLSFLSPCSLGLFPSYVSFISGNSFDTLVSDAKKKQVITRTLSHSLAFILGFSVLFMIMGSAMSYVGNLFFQYKEWIRITGGVIIIIFALTTVGVFHLKSLSREIRYHFREKPVGYLGSFLVGLGFAAGWVPCSGPTLSSILLFATGEASAIYGIKLLGVYSMGLAVPFLVFGLFINLFLSSMKFLKKYQLVFIYLNALVMIFFGIMLLTGYIQWFLSLVPDLGIQPL
ncbi:thiol:disulfide interchange protein precursor [bacterium BMS3Abin14]|nr:thiol:disulfide interchange protein precursor [bacterium BMS3Abin14]